MNRANIQLHNVDCMKYLATCEDNAFELAIVDPPYGIGRFGNRAEVSNRICSSAKINEWDRKPNKEFFNQLFRVSVNQIIWGANNFTLPETEYFCVWDKKQTVDNFASAEYAWVSMGLKKPAKVFRYPIHQAMQERKKQGGKFHPTQKPVKLYEWLLDNYAKEGDRILDTHLGSGSIALACWNRRFDLVGCELDPEYFAAATKRIEKHKRQLQMF